AVMQMALGDGTDGDYDWTATVDFQPPPTDIQPGAPFSIQSTLSLSGTISTWTSDSALPMYHFAANVSGVYTNDTTESQPLIQRADNAASVQGVQGMNQLTQVTTWTFDGLPSASQVQAGEAPYIVRIYEHAPDQFGSVNPGNV